MRLCCLLYSLLFISCSANTTVKIKGSDTEVNLSVLLAETFHQYNKDIVLSVSGGGSGLGIASLLNGTADIANSSRRINTSELQLFDAKKTKIDSFMFAQDATAFVVSDKLALDSIDVPGLAKIFSGQYKDWSALLNSPLPVTIYGRQSNSGTHDFVKDKLNIEFSPYSKQMNGNAQIIEAIKADASGIGYVGAGYVMQGSGNGIKVLKIYKGTFNAISPLDAEKVRTGEYFFQRPLYQYYRLADYEKVKLFLDFEKTETAKKIILASGYYPLNLSR